MDVRVAFSAEATFPSSVSQPAGSAARETPFVYSNVPPRQGDTPPQPSVRGEDCLGRPPPPRRSSEATPPSSSGLAFPLFVSCDIPLWLSAWGADRHDHPTILPAAAGCAPPSLPIVRGNIPLRPSARAPIAMANPRGLVPAAIPFPRPRRHCLVREDILHGCPRGFLCRGDVPLKRVSTSRLSGKRNTIMRSARSPSARGLRSR